MPAKQGTSKSTDRSTRNRQKGGRSGTSHRTATGTSQAGRPTSRTSSVPRPEDTLTGAIRNPGVGSMQEYDRKRWEAKNGVKPSSPAQQSFMSRHAELALNYGSVTTLSGTAWTAAEKYLLFYVGISRDDLKAHQDPTIKRGSLATEKTLASFPEDQHRDVKRGIARTRQALKAVYDEANGGDKTPEYQPPAQSAQSKPQASSTVSQPKPAATSETTGKPAAKKAVKKPNLSGAAQHAERARLHESVSTLDYEVVPWAYQAAHGLLNQFRRLTQQQLTADGVKLSRTKRAEELAYDGFGQHAADEHRAEITDGFAAARYALDATKEVQPNEPKPAAAQPQQQPTLAVVPTPAQVFAPKPVSIAS